MTNIEILCLGIGLIVGSCVTLAAMCLVAVGKLGDDPLPEIQPERMHRYQD